MDEILKMFGGAENLWAAIQENAAKVGIEATRVMLELFYVLKSPDTSVLNKSLIVAALGYQLLPEDAMPRDRFGLLGFLDNGVALAFAYNRVKSSVTPEIEQQVNNILWNWFDMDSQADDQNGIPADPGQSGKYTPPLVYQNPQQQTYNRQPSEEQYGNNPSPSPKKPIWDDDEDVVID